MWRIYVVLIVLCLVAAPAEGQHIRRPPPNAEGCPEPGAWICQVAPSVCEECQGPPLRRMTPLGPPRDPNLRSYTLPTTVGVTQLSYDLHWVTWANGVHPHAMWTSTELLDDISSHGIRAVKVWLDGDPLDGGPWCWSPEYWTQDEPFSCAMGQYGYENMTAFWRHPGIDTYVVRFQNLAWSIREYVAQHPDKPPALGGITFAGEPTYWIARELLERFGRLNKVIIFSDWEQDWQIQGQGGRGTDREGRWMYPWDAADPWYSDGCWEEYDYDTCGEMVIRDRLAYVRHVIEERQRGIEMARAEFPRSNLRIMHNVILNRYPANIEESDLGITLAEEISTLDPQPDTISVSFWDRRSTIVEALDFIEEVTHYPRYRIYIDELGEYKEWAQYKRIYDEGRRAMCWGATLVNVWMWKQTWGGNNHGLFYHSWPDGDTNLSPIFGEPRPGYYAVQDLINFVPNEIDCAEVFALPPTKEP